MEFEWDPDKNELLREKGGISFEKIVFHLSQGDLWKVSDRPDKKNIRGKEYIL